MKLWLDDVRPVPDGWTWAKTVEEAVSLMESADVEEASLDHDLGEGFEEGHRLVLWMVENDTWPSEALSVHSSNPPGAERMCAIIERYGPYRRVPGTRRFVRKRRRGRRRRPAPASLAPERPYKRQRRPRPGPAPLPAFHGTRLVSSRRPFAPDRHARAAVAAIGP
jgi:hypothetical protein